MFAFFDKSNQKRPFYTGFQYKMGVFLLKRKYPKNGNFKPIILIEIALFILSQINRQPSTMEYRQ